MVGSFCFGVIGSSSFGWPTLSVHHANSKSELIKTFAAHLILKQYENYGLPELQFDSPMGHIAFVVLKEL